MNKLLVKESYRAGYLPEQKTRSGYVLPETGKYNVPSVKTKGAALPRESKLLCGLLLCLIIISVGIISQYGLTVYGSYQLDKMRRELILLEEERESLLIQVKSLSSLERIEAIAIHELGLQYPEERQWLILSARGD